MPEELKLGFTNPILCERLHEVILGYKDLVRSVSTQDATTVKSKAAELEVLVHNLVNA